MDRRVKHGLHRTKFWKTFQNIRQRCNSQTCNRYKYYGGKGIRIEWESFEEFKRDMYPAYKRHVQKYGEENTTIDRIDGDKNYSKENCRWATYAVQANNRAPRHSYPVSGLS